MNVPIDDEPMMITNRDVDDGPLQMTIADVGYNLLSDKVDEKVAWVTYRRGDDAAQVRFSGDQSAVNVIKSLEGKVTVGEVGWSKNCLLIELNDAFIVCPRHWPQLGTRHTFLHRPTSTSSRGRYDSFQSPPCRRNSRSRSSRERKRRNIGRRSSETRPRGGI